MSNLNGFIEEDDSLAGKTVEYIMLHTEGTVFNNAAQVSWKTLIARQLDQPTSHVHKTCDTFATHAP